MTNNPKKKPEWEKEFDKKFGFIGCGLCLKGTWLDPRDFRGMKDLFPNAKEPKDVQEEMLKFIHKTINKEVKRALGRVRLDLKFPSDPLKIEGDLVWDTKSDLPINAYNSAVEELNQNIKKELKENET